MPQGRIDNPNLRQLLTCPLCNGAKLQGLVACLACYRSGGSDTAMRSRNRLSRYASESSIN